MPTLPGKNPRPPWPLRTNPRAAPHLTPDALARAAGFRRIAGVDEAGRGPWAGPVVAAAVILRRSTLPVRIDDSKRLTSRQRARAFDVVLEHAEVGFGVVCADEIDRRNILQAALHAMRRAVEDLPRPPDVILVDGPCSPSCSAPSWPIVRGDQYSVAIACASIMAKVLRDGLMEFYDSLCPHYAFRQHKGYGTSLHARRLRAYGPSVFHRRSFRPVLESLAGRCDDPEIAKPVPPPVDVAAPVPLGA